VWLLADFENLFHTDKDELVKLVLWPELCKEK
jgi:hypothetical protein